MKYFIVLSLLFFSSVACADDSGRNAARGFITVRLAFSRTSLGSHETPTSKPPKAILEAPKSVIQNDPMNHIVAKQTGRCFPRIEKGQSINTVLGLGLPNKWEIRRPNGIGKFDYMYYDNLSRNGSDCFIILRATTPYIEHISTDCVPMCE